MKRFLIMLLAAMVILSGCQGGELSSTPTTSTPTTSTAVPTTTAAPMRYQYVWACDANHLTAPELVEASDMVFLGTVKNITFAILDKSTGKIVEPSTNSQELDVENLYTIYEINVNTIYKGTECETVYFAAPGGLQYYQEEEQLQLLESYGIQPTIYLLDGYDICMIGEEYLFTLRDRGWYPYLRQTAHKQFAYSKDTLSDHWSSEYEEILAYFEQGLEE